MQKTLKQQMPMPSPTHLLNTVHRSPASLASRLAPRLAPRLALMMSVILVAQGLAPKELRAGVTVTPYASISSNKKTFTARDGTRQEKTIERQAFGLRLSFRLYRALRLQLSAGQSTREATERAIEVVDEFDEINFERDLDLSTDNPDNQVQTKETINRGRVSFVLDPRLGPLIFRLKTGVQVTQRQFSLKEEGEAEVKTEPEPTYKPIAGAGLGLRLTRRMKAMVEYDLFFYAFPELEPFNSEIVVSYSIAI